jgi:hypothetical protein
MSPGISPGAPPSGYTNDKKGWLPPQGKDKSTMTILADKLPICTMQRLSMPAGVNSKATLLDRTKHLLHPWLRGEIDLLFAGARSMGGIGCVAYPRENMPAKPKPLEPCTCAYL